MIEIASKTVPESIGRIHKLGVGATRIAGGATFEIAKFGVRGGARVGRLVVAKVVGPPIEPKELEANMYDNEMKMVESEIAIRSDDMRKDPKLADILAFQWVRAVLKREDQRQANPKKPITEIIQDAAFTLIKNDVPQQTVEVAVHKLYDATGIADELAQAQPIEQPVLPSMTTPIGQPVSGTELPSL